MTKVLIATIPAGFSHVTLSEADLAAAMKAANDTLNSVAERRRVQAEAVAADLARAKATRRARMARRVKRGLKLLLRGGIH